MRSARYQSCSTGRSALAPSCACRPGCPYCPAPALPAPALRACAPAAASAIKPTAIRTRVLKPRARKTAPLKATAIETTAIPIPTTNSARTGARPTARLSTPFGTCTNRAQKSITTITTATRRHIDGPVRRPGTAPTTILSGERRSRWSFRRPPNSKPTTVGECRPRESRRSTTNSAGRFPAMVPGWSVAYGFLPPPQQPSDTNQFGVYYVRGPW